MKKRWIYSLSFLAIVSLVNFACRKTEMKENPNEKQSIKKTAISKQELFIDVEDIYAALPPIIMHNLPDAKLYVGRAQWKYTDDGILVRIPTSEGNNGYIYATKTMANPEKVNVYAVKYIPDASSTDRSFSGKEIWIDFQDWKYYGLDYKNNIPASHMEPQVLAQPDWELLTTMHGHYYTDNNGMIAIQTPPVYSLMCVRNYDDGTALANFYRDLLNWLAGLLDNNSGIGHDGPVGDGNWGDGGGTGPGTSPGGGSGGGGGWNGPGGGSGGGPVHGGPNPGEIEYRVRIDGGGGIDRSTVFSRNNVVNYVQSVLKLNRTQTNWLDLHLDKAQQLKDYWLLYVPYLTAEQKKAIMKEHLRRLINDQTYLAFVDNYNQNNTGMWWMNENWLDEYGGIEFGKWAINYLIQNPTKSINSILEDKNGFDSQQGEVDSYTIGNFDNTIIPNFDPNLPWPVIASVIPTSKFVGWGAPGVSRNCMDYAKAQIKKVGYQISGYFAAGQTFQIFTAQNGVNNNQLIQGLSYIRYALAAGIPVIVGVDDTPGSPNTGTDNTTDHFIVIVGMGTNTTGKYLQFYDNADNELSKGTSSLNLLYYNSATGIIQGTSKADYAQNLTYRLTMIRKSKSL